MTRQEVVKDYTVRNNIIYSSVEQQSLRKTFF